MMMHLAIAGPLDVRKLGDQFELIETSSVDLAGRFRGGHPALTSLVIALAPLVDRLDLVTLDPSVNDPVTFSRHHVRLAIGPQRPRARDLARNLFAPERRFISQQLLDWRPHVVNAHWTYEYALGTLDSRLPHLITVHDWAPTILWGMRDRYRLVRLLMSLLTFARGRNFAAVSPYLARRSRSVTLSPVSLLPNGLEESWYMENDYRSHNKRVIALNHGFGRLKNVKRLLTAWPAVLEVHPTAELVLAGDEYGMGGPAYLWADEYNLTRHVHFMGPIPHAQLRSLFESATVLAHPSLEESFGLVVLEAMAQGIPVLGGQASGAIPWLLGHGAGVLVDVNRPDAIAASLNKLLAEPDLAASIGRRGFERSRGFQIEEVALAYRDRLAEIASQKR